MYLNEIKIIKKYIYVFLFLYSIFLLVKDKNSALSEIRQKISDDTLKSMTEKFHHPDVYPLH